MCLPFLKEKAENFSDTIVKNTPNGIIVLNESLEVQQINSAAREIMNIRSASDIMGEQVVRILDPAVFVEVLSSGRGVYNQRTLIFLRQSNLLLQNFHLLASIRIFQPVNSTFSEP